MLYLSQFRFPKEIEEELYVNDVKRTCYISWYPFMVLNKHHLHKIDFEPITILYGGNGSGKTTALNIIADTIKAERISLYNRSAFWDDYISMCSYEKGFKKPQSARFIASDDVFDYMLDIRGLNQGIDIKRKELFEEYIRRNKDSFRIRQLADYEELKRVNMARSKTQSEYVRQYVGNNTVEKSNGESALMYFTENIKDDALYLLDEPENSLSPDNQQKLLEFIENQARFFGCQFVIATHSPFLLSIKGAKIYDLDENPVDVKRWNELKNVKAYFDFFMKHSNEFE